MGAYFQIFDSETCYSIADAWLAVSERGTKEGIFSIINYDPTDKVYEVSGLPVGDYDLLVQQDGYEDALLEFSITSPGVSAQNTGNVYVINPSLSAIPIVMQAIPIITEVFIYYQDTVDPSLAYPLNTHRVDIKAILRVQLGLFINRLYSNIDLKAGGMGAHPTWWNAGSRGDLSTDPVHHRDAAGQPYRNAFTDTPFLNQQVYRWPNDWPTPTFSWQELLHRGSDEIGANTSIRNYIYERNNYAQLSNWGGQVQLAAGSRRFRVQVTLNARTFFSPDEERSTRISVRDSSIPAGCTPRVTEYLTWMTAFLEIPYEWGGCWFGGRTGNRVGNHTPYEGYGTDCGGLISCGAKFAGFNWTTGSLHNGWRHSTVKLNNVSSGIIRADIEQIRPGDILNRSTGNHRHVVVVHRVIDTSNPNDIRINIIDAKGTNQNKVRIWTNRGLQTDFLNNNFTLRRIVLSITSISRNSGTVAGGVQITINGTRFQRATTVQFGANAAAGLTFVNSSIIRVNSPAGAAGAVDVTVTNPDGETFTLRNGFTYVP
jgi:hypothetical protein